MLQLSCRTTGREMAENHREYALEKYKKYMEFSAQEMFNLLDLFDCSLVLV